MRLTLSRLKSSPAVTLILVSAIWGSAWIPNQIAAQELSALELGALVSFFAACVCALALAAGRFYRPRTLALGSLLGSSLRLGVTMFAAPYLLLIWAAQHGAGAFIPLCYALLPLALGLVDGRLLTPAILAVGAMLVLLNGSLSIAPQKLVWTLAILLAVALQGASLCLATRNWRAIASLPSLMVQFSCAFVVLAACEIFSSRSPRIPPISRSALAAGLLLGFFADVCAYLLYYRLLERRTPAQIAVTQWLQPLVAIGESAWFLRRSPNWEMLAAAAALILCAWRVLQSVPVDTASLRIKSED